MILTLFKSFYTALQLSRPVITDESVCTVMILITPTH